MNYYDFLENNKNELVNKLEVLFTKFKVQPVGNGYIDCIIKRDKLSEFILEISSLGILVSDASWWCYVDPNEINTGCPHGMGGPRSKYYEGWFSELQNKFYELEQEEIDKVLQNYDKEIINSLNKKSIIGINKILEVPFKYTPNDFIEGNRCVHPGLWLLVPDNWRRIDY